MKRLTAISLLALCLSTPALAGDVPFPGKQPTPVPPCTENCTTTSTTTAPTLTELAIEFLMSVIYPA